MILRHRRGLRALLCGGLLTALAGCVPAGPRALLRGEKRLQARDYPEALEDLREAVGLLATNAQAWNHLGLAYQYNGQPAKALEAYRHALVLDRNLASACFNAGCADLETGGYSAAVDDLTTFTSLQPRSTEGWLRLGSAQIHLAGSPGGEKVRLLEAARRSYEFVTRVRPSAEALNGLGLVSAYRGRGREALGYFEAALQTQPGYPPALLNRAIYYERMNERRPALAGYREYLALHPRPDDFDSVEAAARQIEKELAPPPPKPPVATNPPAPLTNAAVAPPPATNRIAKPPPSTNPPVEITRHEVKLSPSPAIHDSRVVVKPPAPTPRPAPAPVASIAVSNPPAVSTPPLSNSIAANPSPAAPSQPVLESPLVDFPSPPASEKRGVFARLNPANWFSKRNTPLPAEVKPAPAEASPANQPADPSSPVPPSAKPPVPRYHYLHPGPGASGNRSGAMKSFDQGMTEQRARRYPEAVRLYEKATNLDPSFFEAYYNLGLAAFERNDTAVSLTAYEHALALHPEFKDLRYNFALALLKGGYAIDAADEFQQLLTAAPDDPRLHLSLANLYAQKLGDPAQARKHYQRVLELEPRHPQAPAIRSWLAANAE